MKELKQKLSSLLGGGGQWAIVLLGAVGLVLILLSSLLPEKTAEEQPAPAAELSSAGTDTEAYEEKLETELREILSKLEGVGRTEVMLTLKDTGTQVYAEEISEEWDDSRVSKENSYVLVGSGANQSALITSESAPQISGAVILCEGAGSSVVREQVVFAAAVACAVPTTQIFVGTLTN